MCVFTEIYQVPKDAHWPVEEQLAFLEELYSMETVNFVHKKLTLKSVHPVNINCTWLKWSKKSLKHRWQTCLKITLEKVWKSLTIWYHFINIDVHYNIIYQLTFATVMCSGCLVTLASVAKLEINNILRLGLDNAINETKKEPEYTLITHLTEDSFINCFNYLAGFLLASIVEVSSLVLHRWHSWSYTV